MHTYEEPRAVFAVSFDAPQAFGDPPLILAYPLLTKVCVQQQTLSACFGNRTRDCSHFKLSTGSAGDSEAARDFCELTCSSSHKLDGAPHNEQNECNECSARQRI